MCAAGWPTAGEAPGIVHWDEAFLVIDGEMDVQLGDETRVVRPNEFVFIPAGTVHCYRNRVPTKFISVTSKEGASKFFAAMDREIGLPIDLPKAVAVAGRGGVFVPPPPGAR